VQIEALKDSVLLRANASAFWNMMSSCPVVRTEVLSNMGRRLEAYQVLTLHREKLVSLGTLAAGLMHELNNPGAAARRAAAQLRENLIRLQEISLRFTEARLTPDQLHCMAQLQAQALKYQKPQAMSSLEQADAEEALLEWLEASNVENAWKVAPTLVAVGWGREDIDCAKRAFPQEILSDALNWLEALVSSLQLVGTVEESITRVTDLVIAVKKYAYDDKSHEREIDIPDSIQSTLTILAHKFRQKQLEIHKTFSPEMPKIRTRGTGLSQVWTNLLDNAIDASPEKGQISIRTWTENGVAYIGIADQGPGIAPEHRDHIFEPFFTTKPAGVGTGLGLDIAHRIVVGQFGGEITFSSAPGNTEFVVRLPDAK
jgi:signal transduction histidine kinase